MFDDKNLKFSGDRIGRLSGGTFWAGRCGSNCLVCGPRGKISRPQDASRCRRVDIPADEISLLRGGDTSPAEPDSGVHPTAENTARAGTTANLRRRWSTASIAGRCRISPSLPPEAQARIKAMREDAGEVTTSIQHAAPCRKRQQEVINGPKWIYRVMQPAQQGSRSRRICRISGYSFNAATPVCKVVWCSSATGQCRCAFRFSAKRTANSGHHEQQCAWHPTNMKEPFDRKMDFRRLRKREELKAQTDIAALAILRGARRKPSVHRRDFH